MAKFRFNECVVRPFRKEDADSLYRNIKSEKVTRYTHIPYPYKKKDAEEFIEKCLKNDRAEKKEEINYAIEIDGEVNGGIGLRDIEKHRALIGYWLNERYWNRGIMTKIVKKLSEYFLTTLKLKRLEAPIVPENIASGRVLEKSGFRLEGKLKKYEYHRGKLIDVLLYAKIK